MEVIGCCLSILNVDGGVSWICYAGTIEVVFLVLTLVSEVASNIAGWIVLLG